MSEVPCPGDSRNCPKHFHDEDPRYLAENSQSDLEAGTETSNSVSQNPQDTQHVQQSPPPKDSVCQRIIRNFTPSWFIITMSTGVLGIVLHQIPFHAHWLDIISDIFFVLNILLFLLFTLITALRYIIYPHIFPLVLRHPHQSLFLATFPIGLATLINMIVLVCVPAWGQGMAIFAWVLWWIQSVLSSITCFHLTWVMYVLASAAEFQKPPNTLLKQLLPADIHHRMSNRRSELAEMTALYLIPIVAIVISATSGAIVASALTNETHKLWTLVISYIFWGIGTPLSWIILTVYFLRLTIHQPLKREVIVSLLLPIGPLGLSGFSLIALGKVARHSFTATHVIPRMAQAGDFFYLAGLMIGIILWAFALIWFVIAIVMIATALPFPFNMGWWGFVFPIAVFILLAISIGEEFDFKFFKILSCVLTGICVVMWLAIAAKTVQGVASRKMFYAPCLGTDLFLKRAERAARKKQTR